MSRPTEEQNILTADILTPLPSAPVGLADQEQAVLDIRAMNEQLLISGLREHELAEQLQHQLAFTKAITTSLSEGLYVLDPDGRCTFVNPAAEQMLGWTAAELQGQQMRVVIPAARLDVIQGSTTQHSDTALFVHRNGSVLPIAYSAAPMLIQAQIVGIAVTFRDMTEILQLQQSRDEYLVLISHDLRSPLTVILGRAQLLIQRLTPHGLAQERQSAAIIAESCYRMNQMIDDLVERSANPADMDTHQRSSVDLVELVRRMIDQTIAPDDRAYLRFDALPTLDVVVDAAQIERVVVNLLTNARKFSPQAYPIIVQVYQQTTNAVIAIMDHGVGITAEDLPHLFEKHYRARTAQQIEGSGLGLYSSRLIVEAHGGRLWAESTVGTGSIFRVALPLPAEA